MHSAAFLATFCGMSATVPSNEHPDPEQRARDLFAEAKAIAEETRNSPTLRRMAQAVLDTRQALREEVDSNLKHMAELGGLLMVPAFVSRSRPGEEPAETVRRLADDLDVAQRDLAVARGQVAELTEKVGQHAWNLAGCTTLAESRSMAHAGFDEAQAGPALRAVRDLVRDYVKVRDEVTELRRTLLRDNEQLAKFRHAIGIMATLKPSMAMRADDPVGMAREVVEHIRSIDVGARRLGGMVPVADDLRGRLAHAEGLLGNVARELDAAGVPANPDVGSRVRYLAQMSVNSQGLHPKPGAPDALHLFAAMIPGAWSGQADEWFTYRRIGTTPWVDVSWRHGPGVANSRAEVGPAPAEAAAPVDSESKTAKLLRLIRMGQDPEQAAGAVGLSRKAFAELRRSDPSLDAKVRQAEIDFKISLCRIVVNNEKERSPYDRNAVADRIEQVARGLSYSYGGEEGCAKHWLFELASRVRRGETKDPAVKSMEVAQEDLAAILRALGLGDHARTSSCHEVVQGEILPAINRMASHVDRAKRVYLGLDASTPLESVVVRLAACAVQAFEAEKMWAGHCDEFQKLAAKHSCRIFAGESAVTALARLLDSPAEKQLDKIRRAIDKRWFPPVGSSANLADEVASLADFAGKKANEAHRGDAAEKDLAEIRATVRGYDPTLGHSLRTVDAVRVLLERGGQRMKELAEIRDLLDRGGWVSREGGRQLRVPERVHRLIDLIHKEWREDAEQQRQIEVVRAAEAMATERAQRAEAQLREVARRVAGWMPASDGVVGRDTCSGRLS